MISTGNSFRRAPKRQHFSNVDFSIKLCPSLVATGRCQLWEQEIRLRAEIIKELAEKRRAKAEQQLKQQQHQPENHQESDDDDDEVEELASTRPPLEEDIPTLDRLLNERLPQRCRRMHIEQPSAGITRNQMQKHAARIANKAHRLSLQRRADFVMALMLTADPLTRAMVLYFGAAPNGEWTVPTELLQESPDEAPPEEPTTTTEGRAAGATAMTTIRVLETQSSSTSSGQQAGVVVASVDGSHLVALLPYIMQEVLQSSGGPASPPKGGSKPGLGSIDASEVDFGSPGFCVKFVTAVRSVIADAPLAPPSPGAEDASSSTEGAALKPPLSGHLRRELRKLKLRYNDMTTVDPLLAALKKFHLHEHLQAIDFADNKIESLRCLFLLRSSYPALRYLHLQRNAITRKPDYREQVRKTLPNLLTLDGLPIRAPPLALPYPTHWSDAAVHDQACSELLAPILAALEEGGFDEDWAIETLHPSVTFGVTAEAGLNYDVPTGTNLSPLDRKDLTMLRVGIENANRNLLLGKCAVHRQFRSPQNVYTGYRASVYPERFRVQHNLGHAEVTVVQLNTPASGVPDNKQQPAQQTTKNTAPKKGASKPAVVFGTQVTKPHTLIVTVHGVMSWRLDSMPVGMSIQAAYDRTMTLVQTTLLHQRGIDATKVEKKGGKKRRTEGAEAAMPPPSPSSQWALYNDCLHLRRLSGEAEGISSTTARVPAAPVFTQYDPGRMARYESLWLESREAAVPPASASSSNESEPLKLRREPTTKLGIPISSLSFSALLERCPSDAALFHAIFPDSIGVGATDGKVAVGPQAVKEESRFRATLV